MTVMHRVKINPTKIPGILPAPPKTELDGKIENLSTKTIQELLELQDRQKKLLSNQSFIKRLPDKGEKIRSFHEKIITELKSKQEEEQTCQLLSNMKLTNIDKNSVQNVEWEGKFSESKNVYLDSDDDSEPEDITHVLTQHTASEKKVKVLDIEKPLITSEDLIKIDEIPHVKYIVDKTECNVNKKVTGHFKPYKSTVSDVHNPEKEMLRKKHKHWEITAATPPPIVHGPAKVLNLEESLTLQKEYNIHLKEVEARHAAQKLLERAGMTMGELPKNTDNFKTYQTVDTDDSRSGESDPEGSDKEVHDEEPEKGGVYFTVMK